eukprot:1152963-Pelagomonas_calceolata.AAC.1
MRIGRVVGHAPRRPDPPSLCIHLHSPSNPPRSSLVDDVQWQNGHHLQDLYMGFAFAADCFVDKHSHGYPGALAFVQVRVCAIKILAGHLDFSALANARLRSMPTMLYSQKHVSCCVAYIKCNLCSSGYMAVGLRLCTEAIPFALFFS